MPTEAQKPLCKICGEEPASPKHIRYGNELDNPTKHCYQYEIASKPNDPLRWYTDHAVAVHINQEHPLLWYAKELLARDQAAQNCGDHCSNACLWCGLRRAVEELEAKRDTR